jgi:hypothetical protein
MQTSDMPNFLNLLTGLGALYGKPINEPLVEIYWRALQRFEFPAVKEALQAHVDNPDSGQFMPKPADVVRYLEGGSRTQALQAWSRVVKAIGSIGCYRSLVFDDSVIHAVVSDMGGWVQLCKVTEDELPFKANEFEKRYTGYVLHPPETYPKQLTGVIEQQNSSQGHEVEPPVLIGDQHKALLVYRSGGDTALPYHQPAVPLTHLVQQLPALISSKPHQKEPVV